MKKSKGKTIIYVAMAVFGVGYLLSVLFTILKAVDGDWGFLYILMGITALIISSVIYVRSAMKDIYKEIDESEGTY